MKPEDMDDETLRALLKKHAAPKSSARLREENLAKSLEAFKKNCQEPAKAADSIYRTQSDRKFIEKSSQGLGWLARLTGINHQQGDHPMKKIYIAGGVAALGVCAVALTNTTMLSGLMPHGVLDQVAEKRQAVIQAQPIESFAPPMAEPGVSADVAQGAESIIPRSAAPMSAPAPMTANSYMAQRSIAVPTPMPEPVPQPVYQDEGRDQFKTIDDNPVKQVAEAPVSTFSIDVDTSSYSFMRRQIQQGVLPQPDSIRAEELINYFDYDYALPERADEPFKPTVVGYETPWNARTRLLHIGIKGHDIVAEEKPRSNLVFLIDTSGSMRSPDKLPLLVNGFKMMVENLDEDDTVAIATYAGSAGVVLEPTKVKDKQTILAALERLNAGGSTAGAAGIKLAYQLAEQHFDKDAINRVMLATDGDFNVGISNTEELKGYIERQRESGIFLSVLGFGQGNYNDELMQALAQNGNGTASYIDSLSEARKVLVDEASSTLFPIAKDVKIQIEFNPVQVAEYRLIGYETRALKREDFNNDKVDAGEIGAGHSVTAIYEITTTDSDYRMVEPLRYGEVVQTPIATPKAELAFLKLRYKLPDEDTSRLIEYPITPTVFKSLDNVSEDVRFAASVAAFAQLLRGGEHLQGHYDYDNIIELALSGRGEDRFGYRAEFINLLRLAKNL